MLDAILDALRGRLETAKTASGLPLDTATLGSPGATIVALLQAELGIASLALGPDAKVIPDQAADRLQVSGTATQTLLGVPTPAILATFTTAPGEHDPSSLQLKVVVSIGTGSGWTLAKTFAQLATTALGTQVAIELDPAPALVLRSFDGPDDGYGPRERTGLNLRATIDAASSKFLGALGPVLHLPAGAKLAVAGPARATATAESLSLRGASGAPPMAPSIAGLAPLALADPAVAIGGSATLNEGTTWQTGVTLEAWGQLSLGGSTIPWSVAAPVGSFIWRLSVIPGRGVHLQQLLGFIPGLSLLDAVPDALRNAVNVEIDVFRIGLAGEAGSWTPWSLDVAVGAPPWALVPGVIEIASIRVGLDIELGTVPRQISGYVQGAIDLGEVELDAYVPLPLGSGEISISLGSPVQLPGLGALAKLLGGESLADHLPPSVGKLGGFDLTALSARIDPSVPTLTDISFALGAEQWPVIPGRLELEEIGIALDVAQPLSGALVTGSIDGKLTLGSGQVHVSAERYSRDADWQLEVDAEAVRLPSLQDIASLAGGDLHSLLPSSVADNSFELTTLDLRADLSKPAMEYFDIVLQTGRWQIVEYFEVEQIVGELTLDWTSGTMVPSGHIQTVLLFGDPKQPDDDVLLGLAAARPPSGAWVLSGQIERPIKLGDLVAKALGISAPPALAALSVTQLSMTYRTADESYDFAAAVDWQPRFGGVSLDVDASVALHRTAGPPNGPKHLYAGHIEGDLKSHFGSDQLELAVAYDFGSPAQTSYVFTLRFNEVTLQATLATAANGDNILTAHLGGVTFGEIVTFLVDLVDPSLHFTLSAPWDILNKISFDRLSLTSNLTQRTIGITYQVSENLGLIDIETISLTYLHKGGAATVDIAITGHFFDQTYTPEKPLQWDMLNDPPPATPGAGTHAFDLQELAVGQHLLIADPNATTMPAVLSDVHDAIVATKGKHPWDVLKFDPTAGWLFGAKFTVIDTVTLGAVFDDPLLYGAQITLAGPKAGVFAGLDFQILYRKISDTVGEYHVELKLPTAFRHLEFGEVSITLPIVVIDIYTDGGFYLDFGFPYGGDWTVCFGMELFPFVGAGGFYIGKLSAAEGGSLVPAITNGTFDPIIEFGVALALGVGKEIQEGPFSAGLSLAVQGILTGVVAFFNPSNAAQQPDRYYKIDGSIAIVGKLYGRVDFKVITIDVSVVASVTATLDVAAYQPILITLSVDVEVEASIKIIFIRIHFSFKLHLNASFTVGAAHQTPWQLAAGAAAPSGNGHLSASRRVESAHRMLLGAPSLLALASAPEPLAWDPVALNGEALKGLGFTLAPVFTVAGGTVEIVIVPVMQTSTSTKHVSATELRRAVAPRGLDPATLPFNELLGVLLRWGMQTRAGAHSGPLTQVELRQIYEDLASDGIAAHGGGFAYPNLVAFLARNVVLVAGAPPATESDSLGGAVLPIMPPLSMTPQGSSTVRFAATDVVTGDWQEQVSRIFSGLLANYGYNRSEDPLGAPHLTPAFDPEPITEALFSDWFLLVAKGAFHAAIEALANVTHTPGPSDSLAALAATYAPTVRYTTRRGDTLSAIAAEFGVSTAALVADNAGKQLDPLAPGTALNVPPPMTQAQYIVCPTDTLQSIAGAWLTSPDALRAANPGVDLGKLQPGAPLRIPVPTELFAIAAANLDAALGAAPLPLPAIRHSVQAAETLAAVAKLYGLLDHNGQPDAAQLGEANAADPAILRAGAPLRIAPRSGGWIPYKVAADDTVERITAFTYVRNRGPLQIGQDDPRLAWFANAISQGNPNVQFAVGELAAGQSLTIPNVTVEAGLLKPANPPTVAYQTKAGDTLDLIAAYFLEEQLHPNDLAALLAAIKAHNPNIAPGAEIALPAQTHTIAPGDTLAGLGDLFGLGAADLASVNAAADILRPNAELALPPGFALAGSGHTLTTLAALTGTSVDGLVGRVGASKGLFDASASLRIPSGRRAIDVDDLQRLLVAGGATNNVAAQASNFMVHGLKLPDPKDPSYATFKGQYALTQQQFAAPNPSTPSYTIAFGIDNGTDWVALPSNYATKQGDTLAGIAATLHTTEAMLRALNPGVDPGALPATIVVPGTQLDVVVTSATMAANWPRTTLVPEVVEGPVRSVLAHEAPALHPMGTNSQWLAAASPVLAPNTPSSRDTLFPLAAEVTARVGAPGATLYPYKLMTVAKGSEDASEVGTYSWATWVPFTIRRIATPDGKWTPGAYEVLGASDAGADALLGLWTLLRSGTDTVQLFLLYPPASGALLSDALDAGATALVKANLSTETYSHEQLTEAHARTPPVPVTPTASAALSAPIDFLGLLWEASVGGQGGFYLTYATTTGAVLPDSLFGIGGETQVTLLALLGSQTATDPDRIVHPFTTGAVAAAGTDPAKVSVYAESSDPADVMTLATAPPGNIGFTLARTNPSGIEPDTETSRTQKLFGLLAFTVTAGGGFRDCTEALPVGPVTDRRLGPGKWFYQQTIAAFRLASRPPTILAPGLPPAEEDPYAGISADAAVTVGLAFRDLFGNELGAGLGPSLPPVPFRYYDRVIGLSGWPGASGTYSFGPARAAAELVVDIDLGLARYVPGPNAPFAAAVRTAAAHANTYAHVHYQLQQPDVRCSVATSLDPSGTRLLQGPVVDTALRAFVMATYLYLGTAQDVRQVEHAPTGPSETLGLVAADYDTTVAALVEANAAADLSQLVVVGGITIPELYIVRAGDTLAAITTATAQSEQQLLSANERVALATGAVLATASRTYTTRAGDTPRSVAALMDVAVGDVGTANTGNVGILDPKAAMTFAGKPVTIGPNDTFGTLAGELGTTPAALAEANANVQLFVAGVPIAIASAPVKPNDQSGVRTHTVAAKELLKDIATANACTVAGLGPSNGQAAVLTSGCSVTVQGTTVQVGAEGTFMSVVAALASPPALAGVPQRAVTASLADVAVAAGATPGLLVQGKTLAICDYVVSAGKTVADVVTAGVALERLAILDAAAPANVFATGTPLYLGSTIYKPNPGDSFAGVAADTHVTLEQLADANAGAVLASTAKVAIPGAVELGETRRGAVYRSTQATQTPTLGAVAGALGATASGLGELNADMPGIVASGVKIAYPGHNPVTTDASSTLRSLAAACGAPDPATFAADPSVRDLAGLVAPGALFVTPLARGGGRSLTAIAAALGVDSVDLATANGALVGLVKEGFVFAVSGQTAKAGANDTLASIVGRLAAGDPLIDMAALVVACGDDAAALRDASMIVPPPRISLTAPVTDPQLASTFAPLNVEVTIARDPALVDPGLPAPADVIANATALAPELGPTRELGPFATSFEAAFATRRLKLGAGPRPPGQARRLWAVDFGPQGIAQVAVAGGSPRFYALAPISRELASGQAPVRPYVSGTGLGPAPGPSQTYRSIDLDQWLRAALEAIDLVLSPQYAAPAWRCNAAAYAGVVAAKARIARGLRGQVQEILDCAPDSAALAAAQDALYQGMLASLATAYKTDALIQFPVTVKSPFSASYTTGVTDLPAAATVPPENGASIAPRLFGKAVATIDPAHMVGDALPAPDISLSTAKTSLASGTSPVTFLFGTVADASHKSLVLDMRYVVGELEFQIESVAGAGGYQASEWLRFPVALGTDAFGSAVSLNPGRTEVPIPLRAYPELPSIVAQVAEAASPRASDIATAKRWRCEVTVQHQSAAQDEMQLKLAFGKPVGIGLGGFSEEEVFQALAQFTAVLPALQQDLALLPVGSPGGNEGVLKPALEAFNTVAGGLATALEPADESLGAMLEEDEAGAEFSFQFDNTYEEGETEAAITLQTLDLKLLASQGDMGSVPWPAIRVDGRALQADAAGASSRRYHYPSGVPAFALHSFTLTFPDPALVGADALSPADRPAVVPAPAGFDAVRWQNVQATVSVQRNADLVSTAATADAFIYRTPWIGFVNPAIPTIENATPIQIGTGVDLSGPLTSALTQLLTADGKLLSGSYDVRLQCRYGRTLAGEPGSATAIVSFLPVLLAPLQTVTSTAAGIAQAVSAIASQAASWLSSSGIVPAKGDVYVLDLLLYASTDQSHSKPLVELSNLVVNVVASNTTL